VTGTNTTAPSNQKGGISATAAIAAAIGATTAAPTKQKGGVTADSNDPGRSERMPTRVACNTSKHFTYQVAEKSPRRAAAETLVVLNDGVQPSDDVDDAAKEVFNDDTSPRSAAAETLVVLNDGVRPSDDVDEVPNKACNDIDVNDYLNLDEGMACLTSPLGLGMDDLEAGGELKNPPENEEMASAASHRASDRSLDSDHDGCHCEYVDLDDTSYYESNSEDDQKPAAKTDPAKKVPGGVDVPSLPPIVCSPRQGGQLLEGSCPTKEVTGAQYDHELFEDDVEEEDLSYYRSSTQGKRGPKLSEGGPPKPDTTNMTAAEAEIALAE
jgi:hypothetical protein